MSRARNVNIHPHSPGLASATGGQCRSVKVSRPLPFLFSITAPSLSSKRASALCVYRGFETRNPFTGLSVASPSFSASLSLVRLSLWIANIRGLRGSKIRNYFWTLAVERLTVLSCDRLCSRKVVPLVYKNIITRIISNDFSHLLLSQVQPYHTIKTILNMKCTSQFKINFIIANTAQIMKP